MIETIIQEMGKGNFSFAILMVGIAQLVVMIRKGSEKSDRKRNNIRKSENTSDRGKGE